MDINQFLKNKKEILEEISKIIGYNSSLEEEALIDRREDRWASWDDVLQIYEEEENDEDFQEYTVSSFAAKKEKLFLGEKESLTYILAYPEGRMTRDTMIFILSNDRRI